MVFIGFLVFGFSENVKGPAIPRIQEDFSLSGMNIGLLLALNSFGYLLTCSFTNSLTKKLGIRFATIIAFGTMAVSGIFIFLSFNYPTLSVSYFLMYIGNGILEIALKLGLQFGYSFIGLCAILCSIASAALYRILKKKREIL